MGFGFRAMARPRTSWTREKRRPAILHGQTVHQADGAAAAFNGAAAIHRPGHPNEHLHNPMPSH
jgi:hypothetical protein